MLNTILHRRSVRQYTDEPIPENKMEAILYAGLAAASSKNRRPWEFIVVQDRNMLDKLSTCRPGAAGLLGKCKAAIVVAADAELVDVWVEDCASAITQMHLMADALGVGSCWIHRAKEVFDTPEGKALLKKWGLPETLRGVGNCILGYANEVPGDKPRADGRIIKVG